MKVFVALCLVLALFIVTSDGAVYAQGGEEDANEATFDSPPPEPPTPVSPVPTPPDVPPPVPPPEPPPAPPLTEIIIELINKLGGEVALAIIGGFALLSSKFTGFIRKWFPGKHGSKIAKGAAEFLSATSSFVLVLVAVGVAMLTDYVGTMDLVPILGAGLSVWFGSYGIHKAGKLSKIAKALNSAPKV